MSEAVVFHGVEALDFQEIRKNVVRIPEVSACIKQAQELLDNEKEIVTPCLLDLFLSDSQEIQSSVRIKFLMLALVQLGLYQRYKKRFGAPTYLLGNINDKTALSVVIGQETVESLVDDCLLKNEEKTDSSLRLVVDSAPTLAGVKLRENAIYEWDEKIETYKKVQHDTKSTLSDLVKALHDQNQVNRYVNIGPGSNFMKELKEEMLLSDMEFLESIDLDPMLSWFWPTIQSA